MDEDDFIDKFMAELQKTKQNIDKVKALELIKQVCNFQEEITENNLQNSLIQAV